MAAPEIALLLELVLDLKKDISSLKEDSTKNTVSLEEHMRRTELAEDLLALVQERIAKLEKRDQMLNGFAKISLTLLGAAGALLAVIEAIRHF